MTVGESPLDILLQAAKGPRPNINGIHRLIALAKTYTTEHRINAAVQDVMLWMLYTITYVSGSSTSTIRFVRNNTQLVTDYTVSHAWREYLSWPSPREPQISRQARQILSQSGTKTDPSVMTHSLPLRLPEPSKLTLWIPINNGTMQCIFSFT